jgi:hypothetical protein
MSPNASPLHVSFSPTALIAPTTESRRILVIGAGITGMATAWTLLDSGFKVTVIANQFAETTIGNGSRLTSQIAGALYVHHLMINIFKTHQPRFLIVGSILPLFAVIPPTRPPLRSPNDGQ